MPSAVPYQQGLIGLYNDVGAAMPGVYVSWDSSTNFNSAFSIIFRGAQNTDFRFPLIVKNSQTPIALGAGSTYIYMIDSTNLYAYKKQGDNFLILNTYPLTSIDAVKKPTTLKVGNISGTEVILLGYAQTAGISSNNAYGLTFSGSSFTNLAGFNYSSFGVSTSLYSPYDLAINNSKAYFSTGKNIYAANIGLSGTNFVISNAGLIIGAANTVKNIATFNNLKVVYSDSANNISEYWYEGNPNAGNTTSQWIFNDTLTPTTQNWSALMYNDFGAIVATDSINNTVDLIVPQTITNTYNQYGTDTGVSYQIVSSTSTTSTQLSIVNKIGSTGAAYLNFNSPTCVAEDPDLNIIVGDFNNRITYINVALDFVAYLEAPQNELIDPAGTIADYYFIKQSSADFSSVLSLPPVNAEELLVKASILFEMNSLLRVPIYDEEPLYGYNRQSATLAYGDIATEPAPQVRITVSTNQGMNSPMYVIGAYSGVQNTLDQSTSDPFDAPNLSNNYPNGLYYQYTSNGTLYFYDINGNPVSIQEYDTILVSYYVKLFTNRQMNNALYLALQAINAQPGLNKISTVQACPFWYDQTLISGACFYLIRQLLVGLNQRERRLLVQDPDSGSFDAIANLRETAKMYQDEFNELLKKLPLARRPTMGTITTPEFSAPGSRARLFRDLFKQGAS
jgi:hypothetical protein